MCFAHTVNLHLKSHTAINLLHLWCSLSCIPQFWNYVGCVTGSYKSAVIIHALYLLD